ncbi:alpha-hydroxy acid oxidase [Aquimarina sp. 2201CG1-2-11]|uniref:alpha-hydroxy acid oxidase n=1 Tax=Aquimarina discodermiae TaxID=3231043 RepID=UPI0034630CBA
MDEPSKKKLVNLKEFENIARRELPKDIYDYLSGGANDEITVHENHEAYSKIKLYPRVLKSVEKRDVSIQMMGKKIAMPIFIAPTAFHCLANEEGELATVKAAAMANTIMIVSMASTVSLERIANAAKNPKINKAPELWFQLYIQPDIEITKLFVKRAEDAGYSALVVTVDSPVFGKRERDIRNGFHMLPEGLSLKNFDDPKLLKFAKDKPTLILNAALTWSDIDKLKEITTLPVFIKGVVRPEDAELAIQHGVDGIIVSNHGGRQLDTIPATIELLPDIVAMVKGRIPVIIDGGIRRGTDVLKALALGANAVAIGRPILWGLAYDGESGVLQVLHNLKDELDLSMALCGCSSIKEINKSLIYTKTTF